ncbi:hypothetical protein [Asticcacaulis solisilvae]|uniref:hypothetical protein n=1 Tax=Asticcacaulis solisilvae TaxID=1217274 RepID=UPI003FD7E9BD
MPETSEGRVSTIVEDASGRLFLTLEQDDAAEVIERLRETHADALGRAYLLRLEFLVERLGGKWDQKRELVFEHLKAGFERKFQEPDWCIRINDDCFLVVILTLGEYKGALSVAELWYTTAHFFIGDVSGLAPPLYEAIAHDVDVMRIVPIDLAKYFDRADARPFREASAAVPAGSGEAQRRAAPVGVMHQIQGAGTGAPGVAHALTGSGTGAAGTAQALQGSGAGLNAGASHAIHGSGAGLAPGVMRTIEAPAPAPAPAMTAMTSSGPGEANTLRPIQRAAGSAAVLTAGSRQLRVACAMQPLFEMKKLAMIGHRFDPVVTEAGTGFPVDGKALAALDWADREMIDIANVEQGIRLLQMRAPENRRMVMFVPAAFSTFASAKARSRLAPMVAQAAQEMGLKVLFEIRHLQGVPPGRVSEVAALLRPYCMTTMGHAPADVRAIAALKGCGLSGVSIDSDGARRDDAALTTYLAGLITAARAATGACLIQGLDNLHQMAVARLAGASHATIKASALIASRQ